MKCSRCDGLMVEDHFLDFEGAFREMWTRGCRCINCGAIHDLVIEHNRLDRQGTISLQLSGVSGCLYYTEGQNLI